MSRIDEWRRELRSVADPEGVALALQRDGDRDLTRTFHVAEERATGTPLEQRAALAAVSEPRFLTESDAAGQALDLLDRVTASLEARDGPGGADVRLLRKGLGYCWSVAVAAPPEHGKRGPRAMARERGPRRAVGASEELEEEPARANGPGLGRALPRCSGTS